MGRVLTRYAHGGLKPWAGEPACTPLKARNALLRAFLSQHRIIVSRTRGYKVKGCSFLAREEAADLAHFSYEIHIARAIAAAAW